MSQSSSSTHQQNLSKGPYNVIYNIASFLPPASNYTLKHVSRNFADAVELLTQYWIIPFIYCHQHNKDSRVGYFRFANLEVVVSPRTVKTPEVKIRTGKAYYKTVEEDEVLDVALEMVDFCKDVLDASARSCPMVQPVMVLCDSVPLGRCFDKVFTARNAIYFDAPVSAISKVEAKKQNPHPFEAMKFSPVVNNNNNNNNNKRNGNHDDDNNNNNNKSNSDDVSANTNTWTKVQPTVWVKLLLPEENAETFDVAQEYSNQAKAFSEHLIRKSVLESFHCVVPDALPPFSESSSSSSAGAAAAAIIAKNGQDAASICGRLHFARFFSRHDYEMDVHNIDIKREVVANHTLVDKINPFRQHTNKEDYVNTPEFQSMQTTRKAAGVKTSFSLSKLLFDLENIVDFESRTYPLLINGDLPIYTSNNNNNNSTTTSTTTTWENFWSKRMFLVDDASGQGNSRYSNNNRPQSTHRTLDGKEFDNLLRDKLGRFLRPADRLLVGESAQGLPVEISFDNLRKYFETTAHDRKAQIFMEAHAYQNQKFQSYVTSTTTSIYTIANHPVISPEDLTNIIGAWFVAADKNPSFPRLFVADDVSLGAVYDDELYFPNPLLKNIMEEAKKNAEINKKEQQQQQLPARLLTPWILIGEIGTFSDEHVEPSDLHVWVHLFAGTKLWFVERRRNYIGGGDNDDHDIHDGKNEEWDMFVQCSGDTVVVPPRFKHFVLNVTPTFAIARNFQG